LLCQRDHPRSIEEQEIERAMLRVSKQLPNEAIRVQTKRK
jgi:hypothetical protein